MADSFGLKIGIEGERDFKKALAEINSSFKVLGSEMKLVDSQFDRNDTSVQALTARNEVLNKQIEAQRGKIATLRAALENATESFGETDKRTQAWQVQLNNAEAALNGMERELKQNNDALDRSADEFDDAKKEADKFGKEVKESGSQADDASDKFKKVGSAVKKVGAAMAAAVAAIGAAAVAAGKKLWDMANDVADTGNEIDKMSQKIGISAQSYQEWSYVFERCGANVDGLQVGMKKLSGVITDAAEGSSSAAEKLAAVGLSIDDLNGKSQDEQLSIVIGALQKMESGAARTAAASDLLGKSSVDMAAVLNMTAEETEALKNEAQEYGMVMSNDAVKASAKFKDSLSKLKGTLTGVKNRLVGELLPGITQILDGLSDLVAGNKDASESIKKGVSSVISMISSMTPKVISLLSTLADAILDSAPEILNQLLSSILDTLPRLLNKLFSDVLPKLLKSVMSLLPKAVSGAIQIIRNLIVSIAKQLPQLMRDFAKIIVEIADIITSPENIRALVDAGIQLIEGLVEGLFSAIPTLIMAIPNIIGNIFASIFGFFEEKDFKMEAIIESLGEVGKAFDDLSTRAKDAVDSVKENVTSLSAGFSTVDDLSQRLKNLLADGTIDASEQAEVKTIVDLISEKVPEFKTTWESITTEDSQGNLKLQGNADTTIAKINEVINAYKMEAAQAAMNKTVQELMEQSALIDAEKSKTQAQMNLIQDDYDEWLKGKLAQYRLNYLEWEQYLDGTLEETDKMKRAGDLWTEMIDNGFMSRFAAVQLSMNGLNISQQELQASTENYMDILRVLNGDYTSNYAATMEAINLGMIDQKTVLDATGLSWKEFTKKADEAVTASEKVISDSYANLKHVLEDSSIDWDKWGDTVALTVGSHEYKLKDLRDLTEEQFKDLSTLFNTSDWTSWGDESGKVCDTISEAIGTLRLDVDLENRLIQGSFHSMYGAVKDGWDMTWRGMIKSFGNGWRGAYSTFYSNAKNLLEGLNDGLNDTEARARLRATELGLSNELGAIYQYYNGIHSPSTRFRKYGRNDVEGLILGHKDKEKEAVASVQSIADGIAGVDFSLPSLGGLNGITGSLVNSVGDGSAATPVTVNIQFGDVQMASELDVRDVAEQISNIIAANVVRQGRSFA